jgi:glutamate-1-semialdehyde 2,1-aminomutase
MEAETTTPPAPDYLRQVQALCHAQGAVFILDEIITGFRWHLGGAQRVYGVVPDLATFGKALGNGFAIAALVGQRPLMELGGLRHNRERVFLLSTTYGAETHALAAAQATLETYETHDVVGHLARQGKRLRAGVTQLVAAYGLEGYVGVLGRDCNLVYFTCDAQQQRSQAFRTLFLQELIRRGVIAPSFVVSFAHRDSDIDRTLAAVDGALGVYARALQDGVEHYLVGRAVQPVFRKFN